MWITPRRAYRIVPSFCGNRAGTLAGRVYCTLPGWLKQREPQSASPSWHRTAEQSGYPYHGELKGARRDRVTQQLFAGKPTAGDVRTSAASTSPLALSVGMVGDRPAHVPRDGVVSLGNRNGVFIRGGDGLA